MPERGFNTPPPGSLSRPRLPRVSAPSGLRVEELRGFGFRVWGLGFRV